MTYMITTYTWKPQGGRVPLLVILQYNLEMFLHPLPGEHFIFLYSAPCVFILSIDTIYINHTSRGHIRSNDSTLEGTMII